MDFSRVMSYLRLTEGSDYILACMVRVKPRDPSLLDRFIIVERLLDDVPDYVRLPDWPWMIEFGGTMQRSDHFPLELFSEACDSCLGPLEAEVLAGAIIDFMSEGAAVIESLPKTRWDRNSALAAMDFDSFVKIVD